MLWNSSLNVCSVTQSCPAVCDPVDCSLPGSSVHGIFRARKLGWVPISFSRASFYLLYPYSVPLNGYLTYWVFLMPKLMAQMKRQESHY